jgi:hypothetical protein
MLQQVLQEQWIAATALMKPLGGITKVRPRTDAIEVLADCLDVERGKRQLDALEMCAQLTGQLRKRRLRMVPPPSVRYVPMTMSCVGSVRRASRARICSDDVSMRCMFPIAMINGVDAARTSTSPAQFA